MSLRYERVKTCGECRQCNTGDVCDPARQSLRSYGGIRFTSDGFDCALPVSIDSHSHCSYGCLYCFADNLVQHRAATTRPIGQTSLKTIESIFSGGGGKSAALIRKALKYDRPNAAGYPCPVQLGAICDPCDNIERQQGWLLEFIKIAGKYNQPVRMSTKGTLLSVPEYLDAISEYAHLFWVAFSINTPDDNIMAAIDKRCPTASERFKTMKDLTDRGVKCSLRMRPIIAGITDSTPMYPKDGHKVLIEMAAEAGACAVSYEVAFMPGIASKDVKRRWKYIEQVGGVPLTQVYKNFGKNTACIRPSYAWTEQIMHEVKEHAHKHGMQVGVSDPVWKELSDTGCCCGILPDDPVFGNWERENATHALLESKRTGKEICADDIIPAWAYDARKGDLCNMGVGPHAVFNARHEMWSDNLRDVWNDYKKERSPLHYFQGALQPTRTENGEVFYRYVGLARRHPKKTPYWKGLQQKPDSGGVGKTEQDPLKVEVGVRRTITFR